MPAIRDLKFRCTAPGTWLSQYEASLAQNLRRMEGLTTWVMARPMISLPPDPVAREPSALGQDLVGSVDMDRDDGHTQLRRQQADPLA